MKMNINIGQMWKKGRSIKEEIKPCTVEFVEVQRKGSLH